MEEYGIKLKAINRTTIRTSAVQYKPNMKNQSIRHKPQEFGDYLASQASENQMAPQKPTTEILER